MDSGGGWGGDRAPLFDRRELDRVPLTRTSTTQPVGTVHTTHSNQNDPSQTRDPRQPGNGARGTEGTGRGECYETQDGGAGIGALLVGCETVVDIERRPSPPRSASADSARNPAHFGIGRPSRMRWEKAGSLSAARARSFTRDMRSSSGKGRDVSSRPSS